MTTSNTTIVTMIRIREPCHPQSGRTNILSMGIRNYLFPVPLIQDYTLKVARDHRMIPKEVKIKPDLKYNQSIKNRNKNKSIDLLQAYKIIL